jgi:hypothetical protein
MKENTYGSRTLNRVGKVKLSIIMALVVILPIGALMIAVLQTRYSDVNVPLNVARARHINTSINEYLNQPIGERNVGDDVDTELLGEYVNVESDVVTIDIPQEVERYLDARVVEYIAELETLANQAYTELLNAIDTIDWDNIDIMYPNLARYWLEIERSWVQWTIDVALLAINAGIFAAKAIPFVGKKLALKAIREGVPAGLKILSFINGLNSVLGNFSVVLQQTSDNDLLSWLSIGGIIANILDIFDADGRSGWIRY